MLPRATIGMRQKREMMTGDQLAAWHTISELVQPRPSLHSHQPTTLAKSPPNQAVLGLKSSWWGMQRRFSSSHSQSRSERQSMPSCSLQVFQSSNSQSPSWLQPRNFLLAFFLWRAPYAFFNVFLSGDDDLDPPRETLLWTDTRRVAVRRQRMNFFIVLELLLGFSATVLVLLMICLADSTECYAMMKWCISI